MQGKCYVYTWGIYPRDQRIDQINEPDQRRMICCLCLGFLGGDCFRFFVFDIMMTDDDAAKSTCPVQDVIHSSSPKRHTSIAGIQKGNTLSEGEG